MRPLLKALLLTALLLLLAVSVLWFRLGRIGESGLEAWIGEQLQRAVAERGDIELRFSEIDYQAPNRIVLENLTLARPLTAGGMLRLVSVDRAQIDLGGLPKRGQPLVISAVELNAPTVHVDAFLKSLDEPGRPRATTRPQLSAILELQKVSIEDGTIAYDEGRGEPPIAWSGLDIRLAIDRSDPTWHKLNVALDQSPMLKLDLTGELNLDAVAVRGLTFALDVDVTDARGSTFLTERVRRLLDRFDVRGQASVRATGSLSGTDPTASDLATTITLADGHFAVGEYQLPLDALAIKAGVQGGVARLEEAEARLIDGTVKADGVIDLAGQRPIDAQVIASGLSLHRLIKDQSDPQMAKQKLAGTMNAHVIFRPSLSLLKLMREPEGSGIVWASGYARVDNGRLVNLPVVGQIIATTRRMMSAMTGGEVYRDELQASFLGIGRRLDFSELMYFGDVVAARARGTIAFNGDLNLIVNAGPLEGLQQYLGAVGRFWGSVTDRLLAYRVRGTLSEPTIRPLIGGG